jgi:hypothetical protein
MVAIFHNRLFSVWYVLFDPKPSRSCYSLVQIRKGMVTTDSEHFSDGGVCQSSLTSRSLRDQLEKAKPVFHCNFCVIAHYEVAGKDAHASGKHTTIGSDRACRWATREYRRLGPRISSGSYVWIANATNMSDSPHQRCRSATSPPSVRGTNHDVLPLVMSACVPRCRCVRALRNAIHLPGGTSGHQAERHGASENVFRWARSFMAAERWESGMGRTLAGKPCGRACRRGLS